MVLFPVTYVTGWLDVIVFNSIEFWTGTNPISGESPALVDVQASALEQRGVFNVASAHMRFTGSQIQMDVLYEDGTYGTLNTEKQGARYLFFRGDELLLEFAAGELHRAATKAHL